MPLSRKLFLGLAILVLAAGRWPGPSCWRMYRIWYHEGQFQAASQELRDDLNPAGSLLDGFLNWVGFSRQPLPAWERFDLHLEALVELGTVEFREFRTMNFEVGDGANREGRHFLRTAFDSRATPPSVHAMATHPARPEQLVIRVWARPGQMQAWQALIRKYDVPNYWEIRDRSVTVPENESELTGSGE